MFDCPHLQICVAVRNKPARVALACRQILQTRYRCKRRNYVSAANAPLLTRRNLDVVTIATGPFSVYRIVPPVLRPHPEDARFGDTIHQQRRTQYDRFTLIVLPESSATIDRVLPFSSSLALSNVR
ncbi:hypothetical protein EVAR_54065_1 [Eumeta japonica]|uniref:Uncharacterized protein n=1 Tax=Eumeta variegata TaxID=151549 RepID=A0A4C1XG14_EUMVA|nr:hypothetical protein EVAR_54065_1 [Eumeta japonica]